MATGKPSPPKHAAASKRSDAMFPREGGDPVWAPAFAGEQGGASCTQNRQHHPGEGRGPVGEVAVTKRRPRLATSPNWAPAFAGEVQVAQVVVATTNEQQRPSPHAHKFGTARA